MHKISKAPSFLSRQYRDFCKEIKNYPIDDAHLNQQVNETEIKHTRVGKGSHAARLINGNA
jgi:hypothetical protein